MTVALDVTIQAVSNQLRRRWYQVSIEKSDELVAVGFTVRIIVLGDSLIRVRQKHERCQQLFILKLGEQFKRRILAFNLFVEISR
jgi:hypothetical protein